MCPLAPAPLMLASTVALMAPVTSSTGPKSRQTHGDRVVPPQQRLTVYRGFLNKELPTHAPRRPSLYDPPTPSVFRVTSHLDLFRTGILWADALVRWAQPTCSETEALSRFREADQLRARLHRECLIAWLKEGESIERVHFGTILRAAALSGGVEDLLGHRVEPTFSVLSRSWWAIWADFPFRRHARYIFHKESAGGLFTYDDIDFGLTHGLAIVWWKPGDPLPSIIDR